MRKSFLLGLVMTGFSLALHFAPIWVTMLNRGAQSWDGEPQAVDYIEEMVDDHRSGTDFSFRRRPLTTWCIDGLASIGIPPKTGFIVIGFVLFLLSGLLVHRLARDLGSSSDQALTAQAFFHASPTVLFAWFDPMYSYDEPMQYAALIGAFLASQHGRTWICIAAPTVALVAHETSVLLLPAFILLLRPNTRRTILTIALPVILFITFLAIFLSSAGITDSSAADAVSRLGTVAFNFSDPSMTAETLCYLVLTLALPVFLLTRYGRTATSTQEERERLKAFWIALALNTALVLIAAKAREARVFALPLVLAWPLLGKAWTAEMERHGGWQGLAAPFSRIDLAVLFLAFAVAVAWFVGHVFVLSTGIPQDNLFHEYLVAELLFIAACLISDRARRTRSGMLSTG